MMQSVFQRLSSRAQRASALEEVADLLVSQAQEEAFQWFCEGRVLETMVEMVEKGGEEDWVAVFGGLGMIVVNVARLDILAYVLSHSAFNRILQAPFTRLGLPLEHYVSLLKSLAFRIKNHPIQLFYNHKYPQFPLLWHAVHLYNHPDPLLRAEVRNVILGVYSSLPSPYFQSFPFTIYYANLMCDLRHHLKQVKATLFARDHDALTHLLHNQLDSLCYVSDLLDGQARGLILQAFRHWYLLPLLRELLQPSPAQKNVNFFFLHQSLACLPSLADRTLSLLFGPSVSHSLLLNIHSAEAQAPACYCPDFPSWDFFAKHALLIHEHFSLNYAASTKIEESLDFEF